MTSAAAAPSRILDECLEMISIGGCLLLVIAFAICLAELIFKSHLATAVLVVALVMIFAAKKR